MDFQQIIDEALRQPDKMMSLREAIIKLRSEGVEKDILISEMSSYAERTKSESDWEVVVEVLDFLTGWCSYHMRID